MADKEEVQDTSDYKLDKHGKKIKAHRIVFNKGEDDGSKGVSEQMKKTFNQFLEQHTSDLTEEQKNELVAELQEVLTAKLLFRLEDHSTHLKRRLSSLLRPRVELSLVFVTL